jgi:hypothetical protein
MNFFEISLATLNLFSFVLGGIWGLSTSRFNPYKSWWMVILYFVGVAIYFWAKTQ